MLTAMEIGVLGATGPAGRGLAARLADAGFDVIIGSRDPSRAKAVAEELGERWGSRVATLRPGTNDDAAAAQDVVVIATTWEAAVDTTEAHAGQLAGKVVIAMANGLQRVGREFHAVLPPEGSVAAGMQARAAKARVVAASFPPRASTRSTRRLRATSSPAETTLTPAAWYATSPAPSRTCGPSTVVPSPTPPGSKRSPQCS